jgi:CRP/FNR family transcriptional regulator
VPAQNFRQFVETHEVMRTFVFALLSQRLNEVMSLVEEVAFRRMDERLLDYLVEKSGDGMLSATHQKIANDLGSSREVISRLLKELERHGDVELGRNEIRVKTLERRA